MTGRKTVSWPLLLAALALNAVAQISGAVQVYSEDFATDPFVPTPRWLSTNDQGADSRFEYDWQASGEQTVDFVTSTGGGQASLTTLLLTAVDAGKGYSVDVDFRWGLSNQNNSISLWLQRQASGQRYSVGLGDGDAMGRVRYIFSGGGISTWHSDHSDAALQAGRWYRLHVEVLDTGNWIGLKAIVYNAADNVVVGWSPLIVDNTRAYGANVGFGITCVTSNTAGGNHIDLDNFSVVQHERYCGDERSWYLAFDIAGPAQAPDCRVDLLDFSLMASQWLNCTDPAEPADCPLD